MNIPARIFIVEDSAIIRKRIIDDVVSIGGFEVIGFAESQNDAVASIKKWRPDIVIIDLQLKEGSGFEVVRHVGAQPYSPAPRIFVLTNYASPEYKRQCFIYGAEEFFDKSLEYGRFLTLMQQMV